MDTATLILVPLIAGYYFSSNWNYSKYRLAREQGLRFYFRVALYGLCLLVLAMLLYYFYTHIPCLPAFSFLIPIYEMLGIGLSLQQTYIDIAILTLGMGLSLGRLLNIWPNEEIKSFERAIADRDFERIVWRSMQSDFPLLLSMENRKVYVGYVLQAIDPSFQRTHIRIQPILSGYRAEDGKVQFTTNYAEIYKKIYDDSDDLNHLVPENFEIVLPATQIQSTNFFDADAYAEFQTHLEEGIET